MKKRISVVVAMDRNGLIGRGNQLPWHLPADLDHFKRTTMGKPIVMGRRTFESIGKPLPGRTNIVLSRRSNYRAQGCIVVASLDEAIRTAGAADEIMIIGGAKLYQQVLPDADRIYLTRVEAELDGDTWFPALNDSEWRLVQQVEHAADDKNPFAYSFNILDREE